MNWIRHRGMRGSGHSTLLLSSVLALLALACCFPLFAQADSGEVQYQPGITGPGGGASENEPIAKNSTEHPGNSGGAEAPSGTGSGESSYTEEAAPSEEGAGVTGNDGGKGQGSPDKGANPPAKADVQHAAPLPKSPAPASSDDGSSPLVPILIAIAVLAAISIAAFMIRQRRQRDGSSPSLSTKAG